MSTKVSVNLGDRVEAGAVIQLSYLTPDRRDCHNDKNFYDLLCQPEGIAQLSLAVRLDLIGENAPSKGYERISDPATGKGVLSAWVVATRSVRLGDVIQTKINACNVKDADYAFVAATRSRTVGMIAIAAAKLNDKQETINGSNMGTVGDFFSPTKNVQAADHAIDKAAAAVKDKAKDAAEGATSTIWDLLQPLLVPVAIAGVVYLTLRKTAPA